MISKTTPQYKVLLIGSGLMTPPLIDYLVSFKDTKITVASNIQKDAEALSKKYPEFMNGVFLDVTNVSSNLNNTYRLTKLRK